MFVPQHPVTKPEVAKLRESEAMVDFAPMVAAALEKTETLEVGAD